MGPFVSSRREDRLFLQVNEWEENMEFSLGKGKAA